MKNRKILLMTPIPPPMGGIAKWSQSYKETLNLNGITVDIVDESLIGKREVFGDKSRRKIIFEITRSFRIWNQLRIKLRTSKYSFVHCNIPGSTLSMLREFISASICKKFRTPFIVHFHSTVSVSVSSRLSKLILKLLLSKSNFVIVLNKKSYDFIGGINTKINKMIVPNFVRNKKIAERKIIANNIHNLLYVGGVVREKGAFILIELAKIFSDYSFTLVGNPSSDVISYAKSMRCSNVFFTGVLDSDAVMREYDKADVFLFLTKYKSEGFSVALTEAMSRGLPCIVTDWAANQEMVGDYSPLVTVPVDDVKSVEIVLKSISNKKIREDISVYNINRVREQYSEAVIMNYYNAIFDCVENL